jgi:hypothetical protein
MGFMKQLIVRVSDDLHKRIKMASAAEGRPMREIVTDVLENRRGSIVMDSAETKKKHKD